MGSHGRVNCSCGRMIFQCRCPGPHTVEIREKACGHCLGRVAANRDRTFEQDQARRCVEDMAELAEFLRLHFPSVWDTARRHRTVDLVFDLLTQLLPPEAVPAEAVKTYY